MNGLNGDCPPPENSNAEPAGSDHPIDDQLIASAGKLAETSAPASCVLIVSNLVRPFTLTGLKKVLSKCGKIADDKFWINKDKSKCCVLYEDEQTAQLSREYINSLKWPASNPNTLESAFGSLDELNELIKRDEEERVQLEKERREAAALEAAKQEERKQQLKEEMSRKFSDSLIDSSVTIELNGDSLNSSAAKLNRSTSKEEIGDDLLDNSARAPSPAKNPQTNVLHITNLVRPFTLNQIKELLKRFGAIIEEKFWIDSIKSRCYVVYESNDDALKARNHLHGLKWPKTNMKTLRVDFGKLSDVNDVLNCDQDKLKIKEDKFSANNDKPPLSNNREAATNDKVKEDKSLPSENNLQSGERPSKTDESKETGRAERLRKVSPAKHQVSNIILIKNLARPFTQTQLKELLSVDGSYDEERFWIDRLKSMCFACYESEEIAVRTRERLHRLNWPVGNQKKLFVDFASELDLENRLNSSRPKAAVEQQAKAAARNEEPHAEGKDRRRSRADEDQENGRNLSSGAPDEEAMQADREHDLSSNKRRREKSASPARNKRDHRAESPLVKETGHKENAGNHVKKSPGKTLDDLFRKTKTVPSIYWMPLDEREMELRDERKAAILAKRKQKEERKEQEIRLREEAKRSDQFRREPQYNGRPRSPPPRREPPIAYSRPPPLFRDYPPEREHNRFLVDKRPPPFRSERDRPDRDRADRDRPDRDRADRDRAERDRADRDRADRDRADRDRADRERTDREQADRERQERDRQDRSMEQILKRMARSPHARSPPRTPDRQQERGRRRTPEERKIEKRRDTRSRSASSTGSSGTSGSSSSYYRSGSRSVSKTRSKRQSHSRSRSPKRMARSPRSPRMAERDSRRIPARR